MSRPRLPLRLLGRVLDANAFEALSGDLTEEFARIAARRPLKARLWLWKQVLLAILWRQRARVVPASPSAGRRTPMSDLRLDVRYAVRSFLHSPGFTLIALLTLAIGIGANTAMLGFVDAMLLRPLPFDREGRLVVPVSVNVSRDIDQGSISFADYADWRRETSVFDAVALWRPAAVDLTGDGEAERVQAGQVSEEFFRVTGVRPSGGRLFTPADHELDAPRVAVITHGLWQRRYGGAPDIVGRSVRVGGTPFQIIGIVPPRSVWPDTVALFVPIRPGALNDDIRQRRDNLIYFGVARLAAGVPIERGSAVLASIAARIEAENPDSRKGWTNRLVWLREYLIEAPVRQGLVILLVAVGAVLLLACANLANLMLVRGLGRSREMTVRFALGASRWRLLRQLGVESLVLGAAGGTLAVAIGAWMITGLVALVPPDMPLVQEVGIDGRVLAASAAVTIIAVLLAGILPALVTSSVRPAISMRSDGARGGTSRATELTRRVVVVAEIAGSVVLLIGAALLIRSLDRLQRVDPGVDVDRVVTGRVSLPGSRYDTDERSALFIQQAVERLSRVPDVEAAAATSFVPVGGGGFGLGRVFLREGWPEPPAGRDVGAQWNVITPDYFRVMGIGMLRGRPFEGRDGSSTLPVVIVSESFAKQMFGDEDPIGKRIRSWRDENLLREIVGVVGEVRYNGLAERTASRQVYVPHTQNSWNLMNIVIRAASGDPAMLAPSFRREIAVLDSDLALADVRTLDAVATESISRERTMTMLLSALAATALLLGAIGIYGVISYAVSARRQEFGVRAALGATRADLYRIVLRQGALLTSLGVGIGLALAIFAARAMTPLLYETASTDLASYAATMIAVVVATAIACVVPARRAARSNPLDALRST